MTIDDLSINDILSVMIRDGKKMPPGPLAIYNVLYNAGDTGVERETLIERVRWGDASSFEKVLGGITQRVKQTQGLDLERSDYTLLIGKKYEGGNEVFYLRPKVREAIESEPSFLEHMRLKVSDILATRDPNNPQVDQKQWFTIRRRHR